MARRRPRADDAQRLGLAAPVMEACVFVLITRPGEPGRRLAGRLGDLGQPALWWPAFDLLPPSEPQRVRDGVARLADRDLVVFVSPMAVQALAPAMAGMSWPGATRIAAVGGATLRAVHEALRPGEGATVIGPTGSDAAEGGAEALWPLIAALQPAPRRVLIVRAQSGREWLGEQMRAAGAQVDELEAYRRVAHAPAPDEWERLRAALGAGPASPALAVLFSSTEAVAVLTPALAAAALGPQRAGAVALCVHERIALAAAAAGWPEVRPCEPRAEAIIAAIAGPRYEPAGTAPDSVA